MRVPLWGRSERDWLGRGRDTFQTRLRHASGEGEGIEQRLKDEVIQAREGGDRAGELDGVECAVVLGHQDHFLAHDAVRAGHLPCALLPGLARERARWRGL